MRKFTFILWLATVVAASAGVYPGLGGGPYTTVSALSGEVNGEGQYYQGVARAYISRANIVSPEGKKFVYNFTKGLQTMNLSSNLLDFAFFSQGLNLPGGAAPVSLVNQAQLYGKYEQYKGGIAFPNYYVGANNYMVFTNVPYSVNGANTVILWFAGSMFASPVASDANQCIFEESSDGAFVQPVLARFYSSGGFVFNHFTAASGQNRFSGIMYGNSTAENSLAMLWVANDASSFHVGCVKDQPYNDFNFYTQADASTAAQVTVFRFGVGSGLSTTAFDCLYRGFCYFNTALSTNQIMAINELLPRVGTILSGDSKTQPNQIWYKYWLNNYSTWGLGSIITNAAQSGSMVSSANSDAFYGVGNGPLTGERVMNLLSSQSIYPRYSQVYYTMRLGHNDLNATNAPNIVSNATYSITNLWMRAKGKGWRPVGMTVDRTFTTWTNKGVFANGASNALIQLNGILRSQQGLCDYFTDNEYFYVYNYGPDPYLNTTIYNQGGNDQIHDGGGSGPMGTNEFQNVAMSLGYEYPPQPTTVVITNRAVWSTTDTVLTSSDTICLLSGNHSVTMPSPAVCIGKTFYIQCASAGTNAILPAVAETFSGKNGQGLAKLTNSAVGNSTVLYSNGTNWWYTINN